MNEEYETKEHEEEEDYSLSSRTNQLDDELNLKLAVAFEGATPQILAHDIAKIASEYDPIDLAYGVTRLPATERVIVYDNLPDLQAKIIFLIHTSTSTRTAIFRRISDLEIKSLVENMPPDEAVWILEDMSDRRRRRVIDLLELKKRTRILELQAHDRDSAGRLMTNEFFSFHMNTTIGEVATEIRNNPGIDLTKQIFVLNDNGQLIGYVPSRALIIHPPSLPLRQVMRPVLHTVNPDSPRDEVVDLVERYKIEALPVVDNDMRLLGVITDADIVEAMEDIADNTIASIAGTAEEVGEHEPILKRLLGRAPWLLVTLGAGLITSTLMTHFYSRPWFLLVPLFLPLITGMSGNVGIQCSTILVRWMSTGELSPGSRKEVMLKELTIGLLIGTLFGLFVGLVIWSLDDFGLYEFGPQRLEIVLMVSCGVFGASFTAATLGTFSPFFFERFGVDPAVASGPLVTACNDVLATLMFFLVARLVFSVI